MNKGFFKFTGKTLICGKNDKRINEFVDFKKENGFSPDELWSLYTTVSLFIYPRLKYFRENLIGHPASISEEEWLEILDKMLLAFAIINEDGDTNGKIYKEYSEKMNTDDFSKIMQAMEKDTQIGIDEFHKWFFSLWQ